MKQQNKIPESWELKEIKEIFSVETGTTPPTKEKIYWENASINWATPADLGKLDGNIHFQESERKISKAALKDVNLTLMPENTVIVSTRAPVGYAVVIKKESTFNQGCKGLIPKNENDADPYYYCYYLINKNYELQNRSGQSTFKELSKAMFENFEVLHPTFEEQKAIANIIKTIDEEIQGEVETIRKIKTLNRSLINLLLTKGIRNKQLKNVKIRLKNYSIPINSNVVNLASTSSLKGRIGWQGLTVKEYLKDGEYYLVTGTDFDNGKVNWETCVFVKQERYDQDDNIQLKEKDILITKDGSIGKIAFVDKLPGKATLNSGIFVIRPLNDSYLPEYLYWVMKSQFFNSFMNVIAGSTIAHLYQRDFVNFEFPLPPLEEQDKIVSILSTIDQKLELEQNRKEKLERIKKSLMNDLLTGKKRVNVKNVLKIGGGK